MLIKLCFVLMLAAHLIGCLFWGLFTFSDGTPTAPDGWIVSSGLHNAKDPFDQYISTVYVDCFASYRRCLCCVHLFVFELTLIVK